MPTMYIKPRAQLGEVLREITQLAQNAGENAQFKAKILRSGERKGEIMLYARTGWKEKFKDMFFMSQSTRLSAARSVLLDLAHKLNGIEGAAFDAQLIFRQADPGSLFGKGLSLPGNPEDNITVPAAANRSRVKTYLPALSRAWKMYETRFETIFYDDEKTAQDFVFQPDHELDALADAMMSVNCPEEEVAGLIDSMRAYVIQSFAAWDDLKPHERLPTQIHQGTMLAPADYVKVERFVHFWLKLNKPPEFLPKGTTVEHPLKDCRWYPALNFFIVKNFAHGHRSPMRVGEEPLPDPEQLLAVREKVYSKWSYMEAIAERMLQVIGGNYGYIMPRDALSHSIDYLMLELNKLPTATRLAFVASTGREFKSALADGLFRYSLMPDPIRVTSKGGLQAPNLTVPRHKLGIPYERIYEPEKETQLEWLKEASDFIDLLYTKVAIELSYHFDRDNNLRIGETIYRKIRNLGVEDGFTVMQFGALKRTGRGRRLHPSSDAQEQLIVRIPELLDIDLKKSIADQINAERVARAVQISREARAKGRLLELKEQRTQGMPEEPGEFEVVNGVTRIGPYVYLMRWSDNMPILFQRSDTYESPRVKQV